MSSLRGLIEAFDPSIPVERAWTPPSGWYTSPEVWRLERTEVFGRSWHPAARTDDLRNAGAFVSGCHLGEPWVVVRDGDDALHALSNTCRHKGREVVQGSGTTDKLVCGYHAWTYDLRGRLRSAPQVAGIEDFDRQAMSLPSLALDRWGPWAWVGHDPNTPTMAALHPELDRALTATRWEGLRFVARRSWTIECNWKVYVDNYLDGGYHIPHMHPSLDAQLDMSSYRTALFERSSVQTSGANASADTRTTVDPGARIGDGAIYGWLYPNLMVNRYGPCMDSNLVIPLSPDRCRVDYEFYFDDGQGEDETFVEQSIVQADITQAEDIAICESVQRGLHSAHYQKGRYAPRVEMGEHHFHRLLAADLLRGLA